MLACWSRPTASASARNRSSSVSVAAAGEDHLEGDHPVERHLPGPVDDPHPAAADLFEDFVPRHAGPAPPAAAGDDRSMTVATETVTSWDIRVRLVRTRAPDQFSGGESGSRPLAGKGPARITNDGEPPSVPRARAWEAPPNPPSCSTGSGRCGSPSASGWPPGSGPGSPPADLDRPAQVVLAGLWVVGLGLLLRQFLRSLLGPVLAYDVLPRRPQAAADLVPASPTPSCWRSCSPGSISPGTSRPATGVAGRFGRRTCPGWPRRSSASTWSCSSSSSAS